MISAMTTPTLSWTVKDFMRCYPISMLVFNRLGIDTCCGATATLEAAALQAGLLPDELLAALTPCTTDEDVMTPPYNDRNTSCHQTGAT